MPFVKPPTIITRAINNVTWDYYGDHQQIYLTFDDGPTPVVTPWVLETLAKFDALATFFCLGRNVERNPDIYRQILKAGHSIGNHSYSHLKGFNTPLQGYLDDISLAAGFIDSQLFRPPYGKILPAQIKAVALNYRIIMWDILSYDYKSGLTGEQVSRNVISRVRPGSIIVFHDSLKAFKNLKSALPEVLKNLKDKKYEFLPITGYLFTDDQAVS